MGKEHKTTTKRVRPTQIQIGDLLHRGYRGVMCVSVIEVRDGFVHFYDKHCNHWCVRLSGWATKQAQND